MDFEKLTLKAQEAVQRAQQLAMEQQQHSIALNPVIQNKGQEGSRTISGLIFYDPCEHFHPCRL